MTNSDADLRAIFNQTRSIAIVGASANTDRPSNYVGRFLASKGYRVIGVNPGLAGQTLYCEPVYASLSDVPFEIDMVDIFRRSEDVPPVVDEALERFASLGTVWMQLGIFHDGAAALAQARGVQVVMNRCPMIEYPRLFGPGQIA